MSHVTLAHQGLAAVEARKWEEGIEKLTKALQTSLNPVWLIARSKALINTGRFREALEDADLAWNSAYQRNKRPQMIEAHYRRAVAYFRLGELANADCCCLYAMRLAKGAPAVEKEDVKKQWTDENGFWTQTLEDAVTQAQAEQKDQTKGGPMSVAAGSTGGEKDWRRASTLRLQILRAMDKLQPEDAARKPTASLRPEEKKLSDLKGDSSVEKAKPAAETVGSIANRVVPKPAVAADTPLRLQEFQSNTNMSVSIFSKGIDKDKFQVDFLPFSARLDPVVYPNGDQKEFTLDLWGEIEPAESKYTVTPNKVELNLKKKTPGKWAQLRGEAKTSGDSQAASTTDKDDEAVELLKQARKKAMQAAETASVEAASSDTNKPADETPKPAPAAVPATTTAAGPFYPTSSRSGPKDWDKIVGDDDDDDGRDVNFFFKNLYKNASPEQQRAMMKSFIESNGTSLSTDWNDVKDRTVETSAPEGAEPKKW